MPAHLATRGRGLDCDRRPREHARAGTSAHGARAHGLLKGRLLLGKYHSGQLLFMRKVCREGGQPSALPQRRTPAALSLGGPSEVSQSGCGDRPAGTGGVLTGPCRPFPAGGPGVALPGAEGGAAAPSPAPQSCRPSACTVRVRGPRVRAAAGRGAVRARLSVTAAGEGQGEEEEGAGDGGGGGGGCGCSSDMRQRPRGARRRPRPRRHR